MNALLSVFVSSSFSQLHEAKHALWATTDFLLSFPSNHNLPPSLSSLNHLSATKIFFLCCHSAVTSPALLHASQHKACFLLATSGVWLQGKHSTWEAPHSSSRFLSWWTFPLGSKHQRLPFLAQGKLFLILNSYHSLLFCSSHLIERPILFSIL